jgi:hypothetical protein
MNKNEALDLALEALEYLLENKTIHYTYRTKADEAITAIKQARALDKMAENARELGLDYEPAHVQPVATLFGSLPVYDTTPPAQPAPVQPAAWESEMRSALAKLGFEGQCPESIGITIKGWFDAYAKSLTAQPAPLQEPFEYWNAVEGWVKIDEVREHFDSVGCGTIYKTAGDGRVPLTAAQRTWVGLTDSQRKEIERQSVYVDGAIRMTEAKLKEKNT